MKDELYQKQVLARLDRIEQHLKQAKTLLGVACVLLLIGIFGVSRIVETTVSSLLAIGVLILAAYGIIWLLWGLFRLKFSPRSDQELRSAIMDSHDEDVR